MKNIDSELKVIASENLDVSKDLEQEDQNLQETLKAYETTSTETKTNQ
jgi:hypothetical protein